MQSSLTEDETTRNSDSFTSDHVLDPQDDLDSISLKPNGRGGRKLPAFGSKRVERRRRDGETSGECDVLHLLLARLPPRSLSTLSTTCRALREELEDQSIWKQSYINRFLHGDKRHVDVLVQSCGTGEGWRKDSLEREAMIDRWVHSNTPSMTHHPGVGLIHAISLSYPPYVPNKPKLVVGKTHQATHENKLTHREKYEALLAAKTRPAPYILSAGVDSGSIVRSDPLSGKLSKGYWGPGHDASHLRPRLDWSAMPQAVSIQPRSQEYALWGLQNGSLVYSTLRYVRGRPSGVNLEHDPASSHSGAICDVSAESEGSFVTGGEDGRVKLWKRDGEAVSCMWTSPMAPPLQDRPEVVRLRQAQQPDAIKFVRCAGDVVSAVTEDGDLRIWRGGEETRIDVGSAETHGGVSVMELDPTDHSVLIHHTNSPHFTRYGDTQTRYTTHTKRNLECFFVSISDTKSGRFVVAGDDSGGVYIWPWDAADDEVLPIRSLEVSACVTAMDYHSSLLAVGTADGHIHILDPLSCDLLRNFHATRLSPADARIVASRATNFMYHTINRIILENDLIVASIGSRVFAWRAGSGKRKEKGKKDNRRVGGRTDVRTNAKVIQALTRDAETSRQEAEDILASARTTSRREAAEIEAMEDLGLDNGDEALQYAMMLSMDGSEQQSAHASDGENGQDEELLEAIRRSLQE